MTDRDLLRPLERDALDLLLAGDHPALRILREQRRGLAVRGRVATGSGFLADVEVLPGVPRLPGTPSTFLSDVHGEVDGLPCGFVLHVRAGLLDVLEGHVWGDLDWPPSPSHWRLFYLRSVGEAPGVESTERVLHTLRLPLP